MTNQSKALIVPGDVLEQAKSDFVRASLRLQAAFGLRRAESIKIQPGLGGSGRSTAVEGLLVKERQAARGANPDNGAARGARCGQARCRWCLADSAGAHVRHVAIRVAPRGVGTRLEKDAWAAPCVSAGALSGNHGLDCTGLAHILMQLCITSKQEMFRSRNFLGFGL